MTTDRIAAPSMGGVLAGERHPSEKEDRRRVRTEKPGNGSFSAPHADGAER